MIQFLVDLLSPFFLSMGISQTDINVYAEQLSGYVYAITGTFVLMILVMILSHFFVKKGTRHVVRITSGIAWILTVTVLANVICYGPMYNNVSIILNSTGEVSEETAAVSKEIIQEVGEEGMVLLKNSNQLLPLSSDTRKLNVFGWASIAPILGGTGSGASKTLKSIGILQSLQDAGYETNETLTKLYTDFRANRNLPTTGVASVTEWTLPEPTVDYYTAELMEEAENFSDTAVIVLGRSGGEGQDLPRDMNAVIKGTYDDIKQTVAGGNESYNYNDGFYTNNGGYDDFDPGEHYLELSKTEEDMIKKVCDTFDKVIVVINTNNTMELGWVDEYESIGAVIQTPGTGATAMAALGRIISGEVNPSGKTADTYVYDLTTTPNYNNTGNFTFTNVDDLTEAFTEADEAFQGALGFVNYTEGIYLGYKFYETAAAEGLINYDELVQYPFGYGLSYTTFEQSIENFTNEEEAVTFDVKVTNSGDVAGKIPVEIYVTPPYTNGGIEKASVNLIEFGKTQILEPGASETLSFEIFKEDMASYDSRSIKTDSGGYVLEAGDYSISVRADSHTVIDEVTFQVDTDIDYSKDGRNSDGIAATNQFQNYSLGDVTYLSRTDGFANYAEATAAPEEDNYRMDDATREAIKEKSVAYYNPALYDNPEDEMPITGADNGRKLADLTGKDYDDPMWEQLLDQLTIEEMIELVNLGGFQTAAVDSIGKKATLDSDGTAGLNDWVVGVYGTAFPVEVLMAQTWNKELIGKTGNAIGAEYAECHVYGWYGPAMNMHRSAFTGRNFEYYSEDGVLSGYIASAEVNGAAEHGVYAYIKHFVMNDQETNRCCLLQTYSDEQAIRELYMKPFERCIKNFTGDAIAVMSSFNFIGDKWTGADANLLNNVLRDEWGFQGMVITDWNGSYGYQNTEDSIRNGNDLMLGFNSYESNKITDTDSATCVLALRQASKNILYTVGNSGNYTSEDAQGGGLDHMTKVFIAIDAVIGIASLAILTFVLSRYFRKRKTVKIEVVEKTEDSASV